MKKIQLVDNKAVWTSLEKPIQPDEFLAIAELEKARLRLWESGVWHANESYGESRMDLACELDKFIAKVAKHFNKNPEIENV